MTTDKLTSQQIEGILEQLRAGQHYAGPIALALGLPRATVEEQLHEMAMDGLVRGRPKDAFTLRYTLIG